MKKNLILNFLFVINIFTLSVYSDDDYTQKYSNSCTAYTDPFGPLKTGYTMGDVIRYAIGDSVSNLYSPGGAMPFKTDNLSVAQDIKNYGNNAENLYNAIGYLYAGWLVFNNPLVHNLNGIDDTNPKLTYYDAPDWWISKYRKNDQLSLNGFDNSKNFVNFTEIPSSYSPLMPPQVTSEIKGSSGQPMTFNNPKNLPVSRVSIGYNYIESGDGSQQYGQDSFSNISAQHTHADWASQSSGWCPNSGSGNWIPLLKNSNKNWSPGYVAPTLQFFGGRIAHILGVITNDVPQHGVAKTGASASPSPAFSSPLISGQDRNGTALPMFAVMSGGPWSSIADAPQEMIQPSTAHFGSLNSFLEKITGSTNAYNYLKMHLNPTVSRLSQLFSYGISTNSNSFNLIEIKDSNVTSMDQGVIACIQNNTGDELVVSQVTSGTSVEIGTLNQGLNNFYLHTASLISTSASVASSASSLTTASNMIVIEDKEAESLLKNSNYADLNIATYIQVLQSSDMDKLVTAFNALQGDNGYSYNQNNTTPTTFSDNYLVITNFDPTISSSGALANVSTNGTASDSYRMQIIDIDQFANKPYFATVQINKEKLGYGLLTPDNTPGQISKINPGNPGTSFLYPCVTSIKEYTWQSITQYQQKNQEYSKIPLIMIPDVVWNSKIHGLQAYYLIWLMSYAAALTECSYNGVIFGDRLGLYDKVFGLFSNKTQNASINPIQSGFSSQNYRVVVDEQGNLGSGQMLQLDNNISILGCGTLDAGGGFNQDISILNLPTTGTDVNGNPIPVANNAGAPFVNLSVTFGTRASLKNSIGEVPTETFTTAYGLPYGNVMMFSLPTQAFVDGVHLTIQQPEVGNYQLVVTSTKKFTDINGNLVPAGSVLVAPKIFVDSKLYTVSNVIFDFLHVQNSTAWNSSQTIQVGQIDKTWEFSLKPSRNNFKNNILKIKLISKPGSVESKSVIKKSKSKKPTTNKKNSYAMKMKQD